MNLSIIFNKLIIFFPIIILLFSVFFIFLSIALYRNYFFVFIVTVFSFLFSLLFYFFILKFISLPFVFSRLIFIDYYSLYYSVIILFTSLFTCFFSYSWLNNFNINKEEFYLLLLLSTIGSLLVIISNNMMLFFVSIELLFFPLFGLICYLRCNNSLESSLKYIILSNISTIFLLFGISLIYYITGNFNIYIFKNIFDLISLQDKNILIFGLSMILISLFFKLSIFPFYFWIADIYQGSSFPILIYFSVVTKISIFSFLVKFFMNISIINIIPFFLIIKIISIFSIIFGNLMALIQKNIKRLLSFSSIANFGYLLLIFTNINNKFFLIKVSTLFLLNYFFVNVGIFGIFSILISLLKIKKNDDIFFYKGLFWRKPFLTILLTIMFLSSAGLPLTLGFVSKFYLLFFLFKKDSFLILFLVCFGIIISVYYYLKIILSLYSRNNDILYFKKYNNIDFLNIFILFIFSFLIILFGFYPNFVIKLMKCFIPFF
ncbi:NADH-quinone oxidoreductase subunit N [Buchnera aphidicola]|uniref:NADH-quinone oxidoreductase subunit N n=1 Tax=Buchnera aphidicola TaxID=9 RepID=UPI0031B89C8F